MGHDPDRMKDCPKCGSSNRKRLDEKKVPGGSDWYEYECKDCENTWKT